MLLIWQKNIYLYFVSKIKRKNKIYVTTSELKNFNKAILILRIDESPFNEDLKVIDIEIY